ncbi:hypothetical protein CBR_g41195 [Chara braunii]|uniref:Uncharacterized protein n=1 Tax=Chara braunii TaxID=69332 RepID=A0A388K2N0_CHABU|nr:hypothetical protein CBR_g41195 [Chara braunii]|eukprot:GBG64275.1 hypothetical protein CBR_g41195 [Chara braunii]
MSLSTVQVERESVGAIEGIIMNGHRTVIEHDCCHAANADEVLVAVAASEALQEIQSIGAVDQSGKLASLGKKMGDDLDLDRTFAAIHIDHDKAAVSREATMTMVKDDNEQVNGREKEVTRREEREQKEEEEEEEEEEEVESMWVDSLVCYASVQHRD